jgi:phage terminase large subunit-like protein
MDGIREDQYRRWTPAAQERAASMLQDLSTANWKPFYCTKVGCDGKPHETVMNDGWSFPHARWGQHPPPGNWLTWLNRGGRGSGKTRTGAEWTNRRAKVSPRIALIAPTGTDARDIMVEGESGILACAKPGERPEYEPSKRRLTWSNGAKAFIYSGEEPDRLRGPQHYDAWVDEPAHIALIEECWSNLLFGLRLGRHPRICATTTPKPTKWMKELIAEKSTVSVVASTYANIDNLAPVFAETVLKKYEGTRKGRQEIDGEVLADVEGALWQYEYFEPTRVKDEDAPTSYDRIVVAVDPAGTQRKKSDETGIVVIAAKGEDFYVLHDASGKYSPSGWARTAIRLLHRYSADYIVVEVNYGGDMVRSTIENTVDDGEEMPRIVEVTSRRGKVIRADPVVAFYEKARVHHVGALLGDLEDQLVSWVPGDESPDRLDALVHGITDLAKVVAPAEIMDPRKINNSMAATRLRLVRNAS